MSSHDEPADRALGDRGAGPPPDVDPRSWHYREFYGLAAVPAEVTVVLGNCQAESLRLVLDRPELDTVRVPAVHEMTHEDLPHLERLLRRAKVVVTQPIRRDYRGLPLGTDQVRAALPPGSAVVTVPSVRFSGLYPFQAVLRLPPAGDPPLVPYHDLRTLGVAAGLRVRDVLDDRDLRAEADASMAELRRREEAHGTIRISDVFATPRFDQMRTVNHAGNPVWATLGERVLDHLGVRGGPVDPGRPLLADVQAPREAWVAEFWGSDEPLRESWLVGGEATEPDRVRSAHLAWYAAHPAFVAGAVDRLGDTLRRWVR